MYTCIMNEKAHGKAGMYVHVVSIKAGPFWERRSWRTVHSPIFVATLSSNLHQKRQHVHKVQPNSREAGRDSPAHHTHRLAVTILLNTHAKHTHKNDFSLCAHTFHELWRMTKLRNYARMRFLRKATTYNTRGMQGIYVHCPVIGLFFNLTYLIGIALSSAYIAYSQERIIVQYLRIWWICVWTSAKSYICRAMCKFWCDLRNGGWETL